MGGGSDYRLILREELAVRCDKNPRYSLRAFARDLNLTSSRLSEVLNGRYGLSVEAARKIAMQIGWSPNESDTFCDLVGAEHARAAKKRAEARTRLATEASRSQQLALDSFQVIADWYHYAILELTTVRDFNSDVKWIARRIGLNESVVFAAIDRLKRLELLEEKNGVLQATDEFTWTPNDIPSDALKKFHKQLLEKAAAAIYVQSVEERNFQHTIMTVNRDQIKNAKEEIRSFEKKFVARFGASEKKDDVYCLGVTFFRLQEKSNEKND